MAETFPKLKGYNSTNMHIQKQTGNMAIQDHVAAIIYEFVSHKDRFYCNGIPVCCYKEGKHESE